MPAIADSRSAGLVLGRRGIRRRYASSRPEEHSGAQEGEVKHLHRARAELEALRPSGSPADEETHGILAGIYKRLSDQDPANASWLQRCHEVYLRGWELSQEMNNYLGINAASTALWLGQGALAAEAEAIAAPANRRCRNKGKLREIGIGVPIDADR